MNVRQLLPLATSHIVLAVTACTPQSTPLVDPVHHRELVAALPNTPGGWDARQPLGAFPSGERKLGGTFRATASHAERTYTRAETKVKVEIWDRPNGMHFPGEGLVRWVRRFRSGDERRGASGGGMTLGGYPATQRYDARAKKGRLSVLIEDRFLVIIHGSGLEEWEFESWWDLVDQGALHAS